MQDWKRQQNNQEQYEKKEMDGQKDRQTKISREREKE